MARQLKRIDVGNTPDLLRVAEEVQRSRQPHVLRHGGIDLAVIIPLAANAAPAHHEQMIEAQIWADVGVADPINVWAAYDPMAVQAALEQARGALSGVDPEELLRDLYDAREQDVSARPD